jgi:ribosome-binding factor A
MSHRKPQIESLIQRELAAILQRGLADPRFTGLVSVTDVQVSEDGHEAKVGVSVLPDNHLPKVLAALKHAAGHLHGQLLKKVALRVVPRLIFVADVSLKKQAASLEAIRRAMEKTGPDSPLADNNPTDPPGPPPAPQAQDSSA